MVYVFWQRIKILKLRNLRLKLIKIKIKINYRIWEEMVQPIAVSSSFVISSASFILSEDCTLFDKKNSFLEKFVFGDVLFI